MEIETLLVYAVGASGLFASRAFVPAFMSALFMRYGSDFPIIGNMGLFEVTGAEPTWFTSDIAMTTMGGLSTMGMLSASDGQYIESTIQNASVMDMFPAGLVATVVYFVNSSRNSVMQVLQESDEGDELGIQGILSWMDDLWSTFGVLVLFLFPFLILLCSGALIGGFFLLARRAAKVEERSKVKCGGCDEQVSQSACECPKCHNVSSTVKGLGFLGSSSEETVTDLVAHKLNLVEHKRCPVCATRLTEKSPKQSCAECGYSLFSEHPTGMAYSDYIGGRLGGVMFVSFLLGLVPVLGLILGIIYFRIQLVGPYRMYIPLHKSFFIKWILRLFFFLLIGLQIIPVIGGIVLPVMVLLNYRSYRESFEEGLA